MQPSLKDLGDVGIITQLATQYNANIFDTDSVLGAMVSHRFYHHSLDSTLPRALRHKVVMGRWCERKVFRGGYDDEVVNELLWVHTERPYRLEVLSRVLDYHGTNMEASHIVNNILNCWIDTEVFSPDAVEQWLDVMALYSDELKTTLQSDDIKYPLGLVTLYHGVEYDVTIDNGKVCETSDYTAHAWTLDKSVAERFASRFSKSPRPVLKVRLCKDELLEKALFYTNRRSESEVFFEQEPEWN